ncbi:MAG: exodeoxyribonuclease VII large subunit [Mangrovibacterium sp.]
MANTQLTLSELNLLIRETIDNTFAGPVWVKAEIGEFTVNRNGHCYLELVDTDPASNQIVARAKATIWSYTFRMMKPYFETTTGQAFGSGLKILVSVKIEFHPLYGLSLNVRDIDPTYTMGDMALKRREIILRLQQDGVFEMNKELELPVVPQRVAIISSPTAAGLQDFLNQLAHNASGICFYTRLFSATMQGTQTAASIIQALEQIYPYEEMFDVVVIIRGGGAQLDLASFDHYELAYHVAQFPLPVITGIGHDKDETIVDLVAHTKMKTPTAVAEFLISGAEAFEGRLLEIEAYCSKLLSERLKTENDWLRQTMVRLKQGVRHLVQEEEHQFKLTALQLKNKVPSFLERQENRFTGHKHRLQMKSVGTISDQIHFLGKKDSELQQLVSRFIENRKDYLGKAHQNLKSRLPFQLKGELANLLLAEEKIRLVDPLAVLKRGYSLTYRNGKLVRTIQELNQGDRLMTQLHDGKVESEVAGQIIPLLEEPSGSSGNINHS